MAEATAAFDWRGIDEEFELLNLSYDSLLADLPPGVRARRLETPRMLVFDCENVTIELEIGAEVLMGQVVPARSDRITLECADGRTEQSDADDAGFFLLRRPEPGPVRLKWQRPQNPGVVTDWIAI